MCLLFIIVLKNYIFIFVNVNVDKKKNFFVIGYCYNLDYVVLKKWKKYFGKYGYVFNIIILFCVLWYL